MTAMTFSIPEAAHYLECHPNTVRRALALYGMRAIRTKNPRHVLITLHELKKWKGRIGRVTGNYK